MNLKKKMIEETQYRFLVLLSIIDLGGNARRENVLDNILEKEYYWLIDTSFSISVIFQQKEDSSLRSERQFMSP